MAEPTAIRWGATPQVSEVLALAHTAASFDGFPPFNDQMIVDMRAGRAEVGVLTDGGVLRAAAARYGETLELVVSPDARGKGLGTRLARDAIAQAFDQHAPRVSAWAHGTSEAASRLAATLHMKPARRIHILQVSPQLVPDSVATLMHAGTIRIEPMDVSGNGQEWVQLNAEAFADHPEQGSLTEADLAARMGETWFDPDGLLVARDSSNTALGYCWTKVTDIEGSQPAQPATLGEIYALGVRPQATGRGIGSALLNAGLAYLKQRGVTDIILYVDSTNTPAIRLYNSHGFALRSTDTQFIVER